MYLKINLLESSDLKILNLPKESERVPVDVFSQKIDTPIKD